MGGYRFLTALSLGLLSACELSFDPSLDGKRCDSEGACVSGYVCSPLGICERDASSFIDASADARIETPDSGSPRDAAIVLDAAEPQTSVPAATTNEADSVVEPKPDSGVAVADAGQADSNVDVDAGAATTVPDAAAQDAAKPDAAIPPGPTAPPVTNTPAAPPGPGEPPGDGAPLPPGPGMMSPPTGPMPGCSTGRAKCGADCVDLEEDRDHCGACNNACRKSESCDKGACKKSGP